MWSALRSFLIPAAGTKIKQMRHPGAWMAPGEIPIEQFISKFRPSLNESLHHSSDLSIHKVPYYWVITKQEQQEGLEIDEEVFGREGELLLTKLLEESVAPERKSAAHDSFRSAVEELSKRTGLLSGKWLCLATPASVDAHFAALGTALAVPSSSPLASTSAHTLKVASNMKDYDEGYVMNLHCGNSFDVNELKDMAKMMLEMGVRPTGYECDSNSLLGVDSSHASGIKSPLYSLSDLLSKEEIARAFADGVEKRTVVEPTPSQ